MNKKIFSENCNLKSYTTIKVGGVAEYFAEPIRASAIKFKERVYVLPEPADDLFTLKFFEFCI